LTRLVTTFIAAIKVTWWKRFIWHFEDIRHPANWFRPSEIGFEGLCRLIDRDLSVQIGEKRLVTQGQLR
jgi:hypothetical protein